MRTAEAEVVPLHSRPDQVRVVTATSIFDGHDASINIMRRILRIRTPKRRRCGRRTSRARTQTRSRRSFGTSGRFQSARPKKARDALARLQQVARCGGNVFAELMETVKYASLGQISNALFEVGGRYRRSM